MILLLILVYIAIIIFTFYGINCYVMIYLFRRYRNRCPEEEQRLLREFYREHDIQELPIVTSQIALFNEINVAERIIDAVAAFEYPAGKHEIQVLDDSTDETSILVARKVEELRARGVQIEHIQRAHREGFKAGALKHGLEKAQGEFVIIFDADFVPPRDFLLKSIPFFLINPKIGVLQARWGCLNDSANLLTRLQSVVLNGHFIVEQATCSWHNLFVKFNGTAGICRKEAVLEAGNWDGNMLTEDLDLSYRIQLAGWKCQHLINLVAPAELPLTINAIKVQQFRWMKGVAQTGLKLFPALWRSEHNIFKKIHAVFHLTHQQSQVLLTVIVMLGPLLLMTQGFTPFPPVVFASLTGMLTVSVIGYCWLYWTAETYLYGRPTKRILLIPLVLFLGCGLGMNCAQAMFEVFRKKQSGFMRTPKAGEKQTQRKHYKPDMNCFFVVEIAVGLWCLVSLFFLSSGYQYGFGMFLLTYAVGSLYVGGKSCLEYIGWNMRPRGSYHEHLP